MREKLNDNPIAQVAIIGVLLVLAAVFLLGKMGGGGEEEAAGEAAGESATSVVASAEVEAATAPPELPAPGSGLAAPPPPPRPVVAAYEAGKTVVLVFVRDGGIDDRLVAKAVKRLGSLARVATFVVPADHIARYVSIAQGVDLNRVPALVVIRPRRVDGNVPSASVQYGFQSPESIVQAVVDAGYHGGTLPYHP